MQVLKIMLSGTVAKNDVHVDSVESKNSRFKNQNNSSFTVYLECTKGKLRFIQNLNAIKGDNILAQSNSALLKSRLSIITII